MSPALAAVFVLFNGQNLDGWKKLSGEWAAQDGVIVCKAENSEIRSDYESSEYALTFKYRNSANRGAYVFLQSSSDGRSNLKVYLEPRGISWADPSEPADPHHDWIDVRIEVRPDKVAAVSKRADGTMGSRMLGPSKPGRGFLTFRCSKPGFEIKDIKVTEPGFENLFDGKSTKGWESVGRNDPDNPTWYVENGTLICRHTKWGNWLRTAESYDNFVLRLEYWLPKKGNSGIYLHAPATSERISQIGQEIQLIDDMSYPKLKPSQRNGSVYAGIAPEVEVPAPAEEWNAIEVFSQGKRIRTTVNGVELYDARLDDTDKDAMLLKNPLATRRLTGFIGLQDHTDSPKFRNIRIRALPPESQPAG